MQLDGKEVLISGATSGIGRASAKALAAKGARLTLLCRNAETAVELAEELADSPPGYTPQVLIADFADLASVRAAARQFVESGRTLDILLNNAGVVNTKRRETVDGYEETLAVNHLAPFLLTGMLLPAMSSNAGARIVNVASAAHAFCRGMEFDDLQSQQKYRTFNVYGRSKLANILFTLELSKRLKGRGISVNSLHPGAVSTRLGAQNNSLLSTVLTTVLKPFFKSPEQGAATSIYLCSDASLANTSGAYYANCKQVRARPWARDEAAAAQLWQISEQLAGFTYPL